MTFYDIEYIIIIVVLISVFFIGLKSRSIEYDKLYLPFVIDKQMAVALKGLACVLILLGHWGQRKFDVDMPWGVSKVVWNTTANIGLVWFMFFSGYGMSLKKGTEEVGLDRWWHSIIRKSKFPQNPKRSVRFSGKRTKRSVQKRKARNTQKAETKVL